MSATFNGQLGLERRDGHTAADVWVRVLAPAAALWHNFHIDGPIRRSPIACDQ